MSDRERDEEEQERRRPRVVDKRISARSPSESAPPEPQAEAPPPEEPPPPGDPTAPVGGPEPASAAPSTAPDEPPVWTPQQEEEARRIAEEIVRTPGLDWVVNTAVTLANVSATKLEFGSAADAQITIDAFAALLDALGPRLEDAQAPLRQTLAQLQLAYAQRIAAPPTQG